MGKYGFILTVLLVLSFIVGTIGCDGDEEATSTSSISEFINNDSVHSLLSEAHNIFDEYNYNEYMKVKYTGSTWNEKYEKYQSRKCLLRERAVKTRNELILITPPPELKDFWDILAVGNPNCINNLNMCGVLDAICLCSRSCVGLAEYSAPFTTTLMIITKEKNMEAWIELGNICREHDIEMPWLLPAVYE